MKARAILPAMVIAVATILAPRPAGAQYFDPRSALQNLIWAFQHCGQWQAYQMLSPTMYNVIYNQTGGSGCYPAVAQMGNLRQIDVLSTQDYPIGPLYNTIVTFDGGQVYYTIGFNRMNGAVEHLSTAAVPPQLPSPQLPPQGARRVDRLPQDQETAKPSGPTRRQVQKEQGKSEPDEQDKQSKSEGCLMYPAMCD